MRIATMMFGSVARTTRAFMIQPVSTLTTLLYYSDRLPRNLNLDRLVRSDLVDSGNYLFRFLINFLRCFW
ncbi:hypothetical protein HAX54_034374 [Datura stramonium]|uniref:Uncharacterized protein n=1 Tax=Datura stramonium TaxID=4076 RepID=A0ABS8SED5_DATST|nr:hypothetical protein [Datura stramonium]